MTSVPFEELDFTFKDKTIFLDVDGTLLPDGQTYFSPAVMRNLERLRSANQVFLCTNSDDILRTKKIEEVLGLLVVTYRHKKPSAKIVADAGVALVRGNALVIGDKFLIDGVFALHIGANFIKIKRKISGKESFLVRLINFLDDIIWQTVKSARSIL